MRPSRLRTLAAVILISAILLALIGLLYNVEWSGLAEFGNRDQAPYEREKTLWDWLELAGIPLTLALAALWFDRQARRREEATKESQRQDETLQKYTDDITRLLLDNRIDMPDVVKRVAAVRTILVLQRLDRKRIQAVFQLLNDINWLRGENAILRDSNMREIDLSHASLSEVDMSGANLQGARFNEADLIGAYLIESNLILADLVGTYLNGADLSDADLSAADLHDADLSQAILTNTTLTGANLIGVDFRGADLTNADLSGTDLSGADLRGAILTGADLSGAVLDESTRLPDSRAWTPATDLTPFTHP